MASALKVVPFVGASNGSNLDISQHELPDNMARYLQDVLLDRPGVIRQRGPVTTTNYLNNADFPSLPSNYRTIGMATAPDPTSTNTFRVLIFAADNSTHKLHVFMYGRTPNGSNFQGQQLIDKDLGGNIPTTAPNLFFDAKACLGGGVLIGIGAYFGKDLSASRNRYLFHWKGAAKADYTTGTLSVTQNSKTVTSIGNSFLANVEPGMFLLDNSGRYLGTVASVDSNTQLTLEQNILTETAGALGYTLTSLRQPFSPVSKPYLNAGSITTATTSTTVNGGDTKFKDQKVAANDLIFKATDLTYVGKVSSVASNTQLTLTANAAVAMANEDYLLVEASGGGLSFPDLQSVPVLNAYWNSMQFVGNADNTREGKNERIRLFVLGPNLLDTVDLTSTGTYVDIPTTQVQAHLRGIMPTESALVCCLADETIGLFGNTPDTLSPKHLLADGCLSPMTMQPWRGGAVWAGHRGIYVFDGSTVENILDIKLAHSHQDALAGLDYSTLRAWSMIYNGHYIVHLEKINTGPFDYTQNGTTYSPTSLIYCVNLLTGAVVFWTNVAIRGVGMPPAPVVNGRDAYYLVENANTTGPAVCSAEALFKDAFEAGPYASTSGPADEFSTNPSNPAFSPHFFLETKLYDFGDPQLLKMFKQVQLHHAVKGTTIPGLEALKIDVLVGLNKTATNLTDLPKTTVGSVISWVNTRTKFLKRDTHIGFRLFTDQTTSGGYIQVGPWAIGFKPQRPGRV